MMKPINLKLGNTAFLKAYWTTMFCMGANPDEYAYTMFADHNMDYPKVGGMAELQQVILTLHDLVGNAETNGYQVVIGNGATQMVMAAMHALSEKHQVKNVFYDSPHWFRFGTIVYLNGLSKGCKQYGRNIEIVTSPNNPDNKYIEPGVGPHFIYDLSYNWPQYIDVKKQDKDIMIFSLAKSTGHAGSRIGWALVKDVEIAEKMESFIEYTSGSVSVDSQTRAAILLASQVTKIQDGAFDATCFKFGKDILADRWNRIKEALKTDKIKILNDSGMFAWGEVSKEELGNKAAVNYLEEKFGIKSMDGCLCGGTLYNFRLNVGCKEEEFNEFISRMSSIT